MKEKLENYYGDFQTLILTDKKSFTEFFSGHTSTRNAAPETIKKIHCRKVRELSKVVDILCVTVVSI